MTYSVVFYTAIIWFLFVCDRHPSRSMIVNSPFLMAWFVLILSTHAMVYLWVPRQPPEHVVCKSQWWTGASWHTGISLPKQTFLDAEAKLFIQGNNEGLTLGNNTLISGLMSLKTCTGITEKGNDVLQFTIRQTESFRVAGQRVINEHPLWPPIFDKTEKWWLGNVWITITILLMFMVVPRICCSLPFPVPEAQQQAQIHQAQQAWQQQALQHHQMQQQQQLQNWMRPILQQAEERHEEEVKRLTFRIERCHRHGLQE